MGGNKITLKRLLPPTCMERKREIEWWLGV